VHGSEGVTDYFSLLGIKESFDVNIRDAEIRYRALQKVVHPDHLSLTNPELISTDFCSLLNEAIAVIKSPILRAEHILSLHNTATDESSRLTDQNLLAEMMDLNEQVDEAFSDSAKLEQHLADIRIKLTLCEQFISNSYSTKDFKSMLTQVERMRFLSRIEARILDYLRL
jgi:molecular chaperone HscB